MAKKSKKGYEFFVDGKPASLLQIVENGGDDAKLKSFLESHGLCHGQAADRYLRAKLGEYMTAQEINRRGRITSRTLDKWRRKGIVQVEQLNGRWYYSMKSMAAALKSADAKDL